MSKACSKCERSPALVEFGAEFICTACSKKHGLCDDCGAEFGKRAPNHRYCSKQCQKKNANKKYIPKQARPRPCKRCGGSFLPKTTSHRYCSKECLRKNQYSRSRFSILERDGFRCIYCGKLSYEDSSELHVDHVYPRHLGGSDKASNVATSCKKCNVEKGGVPLRDPEPILAEIKKRNKRAGIDPDIDIRFYRGLHTG